MLSPILHVILPLVTPHPVNLTCMTITGVTHTFYGFPDNDPPGPAIAKDCGRGYIAGGTGTYSDPVTFASAEGEFNSCEIIYDPYIQKYLRYEDHCADCTVNWKRGVVHIDIWTGNNSLSGGDDQINCEFALTTGPQTIVRGPRVDLPVVGKFSFGFGSYWVKIK